ncbi:hypothetical protein [Cellulosimicrobium protaetiae]|uniref:hypothetical protein n=1 Tax=Cellulosimicrobium protaetiae TaxID=2587808 RepID=UPI001C117AC0|nr:hypothetical protein [Cellulosimicrobium protaetiae]
MTSTNRAPRDLVDAAAVHAAREEIVQALGPLAASPLDEDAAGLMRSALERAQSPAVRSAVRRMRRPGESRPPLMVVPALGEHRARPRPQGLPAPVLAVASGGDAA